MTMVCPSPAAQDSQAGQASGYEHSACPVCQETQGQKLFREVSEGVEVSVILCEGCGLGYSNPRPSEAHKLQRYKQWANLERPWQAEAHYDHRQQLRHFDLYRRVMQLIQARHGSGSILDIGCGGGMFLIFAGVFASEHNAGINSRYRVEGAAFDPQEAALSRQISGVTVHSIADLAHLPAGRFEAITLLNVLEHVNQPLDLLRQSHRLLKPGGVLVLVVPNNSMAFWRLRGRIRKPPASLAAGEHINHFRPASLRKALRRCGFARVRFAPDVLVGDYGSMAPLPPAQWIKYGIYRALDALSFSRCYLYADLLVVADRD